MTDAKTPDEKWMRRSLELARAAIASGDAAVGCVVTRGGRLLAEGQEAVRSLGDPAAHAEAEALRAACRTLGGMNLAGCTLYTTTEPCWMCAFLIRQTGISRIVIGVAVDDIGGLTSRYPILSDGTVPDMPPPPEVVWGCLCAECAALGGS